MDIEAEAGHDPALSEAQNRRNPLARQIGQRLIAKAVFSADWPAQLAGPLWRHLLDHAKPTETIWSLDRLGRNALAVLQRRPLAGALKVRPICTLVAKDGGPSKHRLFRSGDISKYPLRIANGGRRVSALGNNDITNCNPDRRNDQQPEQKGTHKYQMKGARDQLPKAECGNRPAPKKQKTAWVRYDHAPDTPFPAEPSRD